MRAILVALALVLATSGEAKAQDWWWQFSYNMGTPGGSTTDYINSFSFRGIGYGDFRGIHVIETPDAVFLCNRHHQHRTRAADFFGRRNNIVAVIDRSAHRPTEARMHHRGGVFDFAIDADDRAFAIGFDFIGFDA